MEVATRAFDKLAANNGDLLESTFKSFGAFKKDPMAKARQLLRLAALLHDIGHAPFSHAAEEVFCRDIGGKHEALTERLLKEDFGKFIDRIYWAGCSELIASTISKELAPQLKVIVDIVSGEMDADRIDYLIRDSHHCGVSYGIFDYIRMLECLELYEPEPGTLEIALHRDGLHTFEALILARYQMNTQVYFHRVRRIYDYYLKEYLKALGPDCPTTFTKPRVIWAFFNNMKGDSNCKRMLSIQDTCVLS